jgi:hypothetical protein
LRSVSSGERQRDLLVGEELAECVRDESRTLVATDDEGFEMGMHAEFGADVGDE